MIAFDVVEYSTREHVLVRVVHGNSKTGDILDTHGAHM